MQTQSWYRGPSPNLTSINEVPSRIESSYAIKWPREPKSAINVKEKPRRKYCRAAAEISQSKLPLGDLSAASERQKGEMILPEGPQLGGKAIKSRWNAVHLAFLGDSVWELYVRNHFFSPPKRLTDYYDAVRTYVRAETQAEFHDEFLRGSLLNAEELDVLRWGGNAKIQQTPKRFSASKGHGVGTYKKATAFECLLGYIYLTDVKRLNDVVGQLLSKPPPPEAGQ